MFCSINDFQVVNIVKYQQPIAIAIQCQPLQYCICNFVLIIRLSIVHQLAKAIDQTRNTHFMGNCCIVYMCKITVCCKMHNKMLSNRYEAALQSFCSTCLNPDDGSICSTVLPCILANNIGFAYAT